MRLICFINNNGIPFDVSLPPEKLLSIGNLSKKELDAELDKDYQDMIDKRVKPAEQTFSDIRRDYNL